MSSLPSPLMLVPAGAGDDPAMCPRCGTPLVETPAGLHCVGCSSLYPTIADLRAQLERPPFAYPNPGPLYAAPVYPGNGYPPNPDEARPGGSAFGRLAKGQPLGKSVTLLYNAELEGAQPSDTELLRIEGDDLDACQMIVTLAPPQVTQTAFDELPSDFSSSPSMGVTNGEANTGEDFPGDDDPITWPPLEAIVEWGIKGVQHKAIVDFVNGVTFSVTASFLKVSAVVSQNVEADVTGTSAAYVLAGCVGPGYSHGNARRTVFIESLDNTEESVTFDVPRFATKAYLLARDNGVTPQIASAYVRFWRSPDGQAGGNSAGQVFVNSNQPIAFDIPNGAAYFSVYNQGSAMPFAVVFELSLT